MLEICTGNYDNSSVDLNFHFKTCQSRLPLQGRASNCMELNYLKFIYAKDFSLSPFSLGISAEHTLIHTILLPLVGLLLAYAS